MAWLLAASACGRLGFDRADEVDAMSEVPVTGLVGHWMLDELGGTTVVDNSGNGHDGTWRGEPVLRAAAGVSGGALEFDGTDDYINIADHADFDITNAITISAWIYLDNIGSQKAILDKKFDGAASGFRFVAFWSTLNFRFSDGITTNIHVFAADGILQPGRWYHAGVVYDRETVRLYLDANEVVAEAHTEPIATNSVSLRIANYASNAYWLDGRVDDVRLYNRALSASDISNLYCVVTGTC
jgi:hypothetical protein